ncbi:CHAT domain-containing protein [Hoeflea sp. AS60]|uniref:CHAT domain-containing protein n=1 Tax=Hoeflea sp. AS60 TaxID=3135780 RepID=UPI00318033FB
MFANSVLAPAVVNFISKMIIAAATLTASPALSDTICANTAIEKLLLEDTGKTRRAKLQIALECKSGVDRAILGQVAYELSIEAYLSNDDPLAKVLETLKYLERADSELKQSDRLNWRQIRLVRLRLLEEESELRGSREPLDEARALLEELRKSAPQNVDNIEVLERTVWLESALRTWRDPDGWQRALAAIDTALGSASFADELLRTDLLAQKAVLLGLGPAERKPTEDELAAGVAAHEKAISEYERLGAPQKAVRERINLATSLISVGTPAALGQATDLAQQAADAAEDPATKGSALLVLGNALFQGITSDGVTRNERAVQAYRRAVSELPKNHPMRVTAKFNLILALSSSAINVEAYLDEAEQRARALVEQLEDHNRAHANQLLGTVLLSQATLDHELLQDAEQAIADAASEQDMLEISQQLALLGDIAELTQLNLIEGNATLADVELAYQKAIAFAAANHELRIWASLQNNLGNLYANRKQTDLIPSARRAYTAALTIRTTEALPSEYVDTITNLASLDFNSGQWQEAASLYMTVLSKHLDLFQAMDGPIREAALEDSKRRFERAAYALAREGKLWEALSVVELGRARAMKKRLGENLEDAGYPSALQWRPSPPPDGVLVLVPVITTKGTMVLAIMNTPKGPTIAVLFLEGFDADSVVAHVAGEGGWLESYETATDAETASGSLGAQVAHQLPKGIDAIDLWLGTAFAAPVLDWSKQQFSLPFNQIALSVQGELAILPLHSAILPGGRRLIADYEVSYLPSLAFLSGKASQKQPDLLVTVSNPSNDYGLPVSNIEAKVASEVWKGKSENLSPREVTPARFLTAFKNAGTLLFVGHGKYDPVDPLKSYLVMANGDQLSVSEIQGAGGSGAPRLVILSACETGIVGVRTASNEYEGLAGAFLALGADGVIASLWPVNEFATMLLMERFHQEMRHGAAPPRALSLAQNWLANAPASELLAIVESRYLPLAMRDSSARSALANFRAYLASSGRLPVFNSPYYWAGLIYTGALGS